MNRLVQIPYPRYFLSRYIKMAFGVSFSVAFILLVFQPFGTASFNHPYKSLILLGYGVVVFVSIIIYYFLSINLFNKDKADRWNIVYEVIDLFLCVVFSFLMVYVYIVEVFDLRYSLIHLFKFLGIASSVAAIPVGASLYLMYFNWKGVSRAQLNQKTEDNKEEFLTLIGSNKSDVIKAESNDICLVKSQDNYVMLYVLKENTIQRHIMRNTLKELKKQLPKEFIQVHRSYI